MNNIFALTEFNDKLPITIIRYYGNGNGNYLIYTLGEKDANGYEKLYIVKVVNVNNIYSTENIIDENEWNVVKDNIKQIINSNRNGEKIPITDLDSNLLSNIIITDSKAFKLLSDLVKILGENINISTSMPANESPVEKSVTAVESNTTPLTAEAPVTSVEPNVTPLAPEEAPIPGINPAITTIPLVNQPTITNVEPNTTQLTPEVPVTPVEPNVTPLAPEAPVTSNIPTNETPAINEEPDYKAMYNDAQIEIEALKAKIASIKEVIDN